jgi:hypothetical protein
MRFSLSLFLAQTTLLHLCQTSGRGEESIVAHDAPTPAPTDLVFGAATDDVVMRSTVGREAVAVAADRFDKVCAEEGIVKNPAKDADGVLNGELVGVCLEDGIRLAVPPAGVLALLWFV